MKSLQIIIDRINQRKSELGEGFNPNQLRSIIRDQETPLDEFEIPDDNIEGRPYTRKILFSNEIIEVVLCKWNPGAESMIHDYGQCYGIARVLRGTIGFNLYNPYLEILGHGTVPAVDTFDMPQGIIHKMFNLDKDDYSISIHFYCPNVSGMTLFLPEQKQKVLIKRGLGAWKPRAEDIVSVLPIDEKPVVVEEDKKIDD